MSTMQSANPNHVSRQVLKSAKIFLMGILVFTVLTAITASATYWISQQAGNQLRFAAIFWYHLANWSPWAVMVPVIFAITTRFPFARHTWPKTLGIHIALSFAWLPPYWLLILLGRALSGNIGWDTVLPQFTQYFGINTFVDYYWYWIIALAAHAWLFFRNTMVQKRQTAALELKNLALKKSLAEAHLQGLRAQLQPHFLYNTHNTIGALIREGNGKGALKVLNQLSTLLRYSLEHDPQQTVPLDGELQLLGNYLAIQKIRFPERLSVHMDICPQCRQAVVPSMILQPLMENAVQHGILSEAEGDTITLQVRRIGPDLRIQIINTTGPESKDSSGFGIGLKNTRQRLQHLYGDRQNLELEALDASRTAATITLPFSA